MEEIPQFTYPRLLETIKRIDIIWFKEDFPKYCFEIEHTTDVTKGLLRLYHVRELQTKLFVIAPQEIISKFKTEINKDPFFKIKERYTFKSYEQLALLYQKAKDYHSLEREFLG